MGRRSSKSSPAMGAAPSFDTVGVTILPGVGLPEWAAPGGDSQMLAGTELIADAAPVDVGGPSQAGAPEYDAQASPQGWAAEPAAAEQAAPLGAAATAQEPAFAMAGAALVGATAGAAGYGQPDPGFVTEPSRYPAAPTAGYPAAPAAAVFTAAPGYAPPTSAAPGYAPPTSAAPGYAPGAVPGYAPPSDAGSSYAPAVPAPAGATPTGPASAYGQAWAPAAASAAAAPAAVSPTGTITHPAPGAPDMPDATGPGPMADPTTGSAAPPAPSEAWGSPERATLSPQHVALLSWWADMMAAGQFPSPNSTPTPGATPPVTASHEARRRSGPLTVAAVSLVAVAAVGTAAVLGPKFLASDEPVVVPATELTMPATVGGLVAMTDPAVGSELEPLLGLGLRPAGVTVTGAYGTAPEGPLVLAAMATTTGAPAEAVGQIATWAERTDATVAPSVAGTGATDGITCAAVEAIPEEQPGSFCVWSASGKRGQSYAVAASVEDALTLTNQLRTSITGG